MNLGDDIKMQVRDFGSDVKKQVTQIPKKTAETIAEQAGLLHEAKAGFEKKEHSYTGRQNQLKEQETQRMINALYAPSEPQASSQEQKKTASLSEQLGFGKKPNTTESLAGQLGIGTNPNTVGAKDQLGLNLQQQKTPEEQQKLQQLKQQLHNDYYQRLTTPQTPPETEQREKEEREKQETAQQRMERLALEDEKKKKEEEAKKNEKPMAVQMGQQSAEKFRGTSG